MGAVEHDELHWRIADAMAESSRWVPEMGWHATCDRNSRHDGHLEYFLQHGVEDDAWRAYWMTRVAPGARLGDESLKRVLRSRKYRSGARISGPERLHLFERSTRRLRTALAELQWIAQSAYWCGRPPAPSLVPLLSADASPTPTESFWLMSDTMRRIGAKPYTAFYVRRTVIENGATRGTIDHTVAVNLNALESTGWPVVENVTGTVWTRRGKSADATTNGHPLLAPISRKLHALGFHGEWTGWNKDTRRFTGTFHGPQRPLRDYFSRGSALFAIGPQLDRLAR